MRSDEYVLDVDDLNITFGSRRTEAPAVRGVGFRVRRGQTLGIVGESGAGKSAACLAVMGLLPPAAQIEAERVELLGHDLRALSDAEVRRIRGREAAMIFQEPGTSLDPLFRVGHQIAEAIKVHERVPASQAWERSVRLLEEVGIEDPAQVARRYPHQLSGGQVQRVMIAIALSCDPSVLIADEPTTALDVTLEVQILDLIRRLRDDRGMSVVFISHDLDVISSIADDILVMYRGRVVESGDREQIIARPEHPYTRALFACRPRLDSPVERLSTVADAIGMDDNQVASTPIAQVNDPDSGTRRRPARSTMGKVAGKPGNRPGRPAVESQPDPLITIEDLRVEYPQGHGKRQKHRAVDAVSFEVYRGETFGLVGESGSGKSTTARAVERLVDVSVGDIVVDGRSVIRLRRKDLRAYRRKVQMVFQDPYGSLNPKMTVRASLVEPMLVHGIGESDRERQAAAAKLLDDVGLERRYLDRYPHQFSGGERQRICIARALAVGPDLLVCDESVSALDVSVQAQVLNLLKDLQDEHGLTYIFISHDMSVISHMCDRIAVMKNGSLVEVNDSATVLHSPEQDYTKQLIDAVRTTSVAAD